LKPHLETNKEIAFEFDHPNESNITSVTINSSNVDHHPMTKREQLMLDYLKSQLQHSRDYCSQFIVFLLIIG
jgi:hypothetical protein